MKQLMYVKPTQMSGSVTNAMYTQPAFSLQRNCAENISSKIPGRDALPIVFTHGYFGIYIPKA